MDLERRVIHIRPQDCPAEEVAARLKKHAGVDLENIPAKYGSSVRDAQEIVFAKLRISLVFQCFDIERVDAEGVHLVSGHCFGGEMAPRIMKDAKQLVCLVSTLAGFNEVRDSTPDVMVNYFLDTWGSIYAECGQSHIEAQVAKLLAGTGERSAYAWNPGQYNFDLYNQRPLFDLLKPEDIGCVLDKHMRMLPFKSSSGVIPIVDAGLPAEKDLIPCDFCSLSPTCPASKSKRRRAAAAS